MAEQGGAGGRASQVVVAGGGIVGLALALALRQGSNGRLRVAVCDPAFPSGRGGARGTGDEDGRASSISAGARRMLTRLGVWEALAAIAEPMREMVITDSRLGDPVRQTFLTFDGEVEPGEPFAHMVENAALEDALRQACTRAGVEAIAARVSRFATAGGRVAVTLSTGERREANLLVAADGARSAVRQLAGISWIGRGYGQRGLVATVAHEWSHEGRAVQHFLPSGPFALLPLSGRRSSIVWTERAAEAETLLALDDEDLLAELERRAGLALGALSFVTRPRAFPLSIGIARRFVGERLALVGDAAHVIHPLAGLGINLGLRDAAVLAEVVADDLRVGLLPGEPEALRRYERARRFDTVTLGAATDGLNRLFSNDVLGLRLARDLGLGLVDRMPGLKRLFIRDAAGLAGAVPRLMRGEEL